ncbi:MAG: hypothetical protein AB7U27_10825, partial [Aminobacteriaceae bacterium]
MFPLFSFTAEDVLTENNNHAGRTKKAEGRLSFPLLSNDRANYGRGIGRSAPGPRGHPMVTQKTR